jgi:glucose-6-phosphate 1-dehydrogenase
LFDRIDSVETAWSLVQPFLDAWGPESTVPISIYDAGSWGPAEADAQLARDNRSWRLL